MDNIRPSTVSDEASSAAIPRMRKRTKTGCLPCRKRRIKCSEEMPTCSNCTKSKRICEGYRQRFIFTNPLEAPSESPWVPSSMPMYNSIVRYSASDEFIENNATRMIHSSLGYTRPSANITTESCSSIKTQWSHPQLSTNVLPIYQDVPPKNDKDILAHDYEASDLVVPGGNPQRVECVSLRQNDNTVYPQTETIGTIETKVENKSYFDIFKFRKRAGMSNWFDDDGTFMYEEIKDSDMSRDSGVCMDSELEKTTEEMSENDFPSEIWTISLSGEALPPNIGERASLLSDAAVTDNSSLESEVSMSTEEEDEPPPLEAERCRVVDRVMIYFYTIFQALPAVTRRGCEESKTSSSQPASNNSIETSGSTSIHVSPLQTRLGKHLRQNNDQDDSDEEDGRPPKRIQKEKTLAYSKKSKQKFACPYRKRDPEKFLTKRSCVGPGWDEVRRVKEHLYRNHALPIFCRRCYTIFKAESLLEDHQRAIDPCAMRPKENIEGFDKLQLERLKSRKKSQTEPSEEDKWRDVYRILFPMDDDSIMPSPYLDDNWQQMYQKRKSTGSTELAHYEQFLRRELPPAVRRELESAVEREFNPLEERLKTQLIDIVRDLQLQLFQSYTESRRAIVSATSAPGSKPTTAADDTNETYNATMLPVFCPTEELIAQDTTLENLLASYEPAPPLQPDSTLNFDPILFDFDDMGSFEDSTYGSLLAESKHPRSTWNDPLGYFYNIENDNGEGPSNS